MGRPLAPRGAQGGALTGEQLRASVLSAAQRGQALAHMAEHQFDLLVVGGGVTGAGTALDAASRGLCVALLEAQDWAAGTSSRSSKLVHGGLRYLRMLDFHLVREGLRERSLLMGEVAPHLVRPLPILFPVRRPVAERAWVGAGVALYDLLARLSRSGAALPRHRHLWRAATLAAAPALAPGTLRGSVLFHDGQVDDARFVVELVRTACALGVCAATRARATGLLRQGGRVCGARALDTETGAEIEVRARATIIATGAWATETEALAGAGEPIAVRPTKGVHLVVPRDRLELGNALILPTANSVLFVLPFGPNWLVGTTDTDWPYSRGHPLATAADVAYLLSELNQVLAKPLTPQDVAGVFAGLRPLVAKPGAGGTTTSKVSREHAVSEPVPGLVVVSGGKYTTYRVMAEDAVTFAVSRWGRGRPGRAVPASSTAHLPLLGAQGLEAARGQVAAVARRWGLSQDRAEALVDRYGAQAANVLGQADAEPSLAQPVPGAEHYLGAEVAYAVTHEGALHLQDVLWRRCRVEANFAPGLGRAAQAMAAVMAPRLGWDRARAQAEVEDCQAQADLAERAARYGRDDSEVAAWAEAAAAMLPAP